MKKTLIISLLFCAIVNAAGFSGSKQSKVCILRIDDFIINPIIAQYISEEILFAAENGFECIIIEMDTPGGLLNSTRSIVKDILNSPVPIIVYVSPQGSRAGSAGVFITMASHIAVMAPGTNIGAAHPVNIGGEKRNIWDRLFDLLDKNKKLNEKRPIQQKEHKDKSALPKKEDESISEEPDNPMSEKILNDSVAWIRALARTHNRNEEWAADSVTKSVSITASEALENNVVDLMAANIEDILKNINKKTLLVKGNKVVLDTENPIIEIREMRTQKKILNVLSNPTIAYILMILGFYGLLYEITHPGIGFPGIAGFICMVLAFLSFQALPINYAGFLLIGLAVALFITEVSVPSYGLLTLGGLIAMVLGSLMLFDSPETFARVSLSIILPVAASTAGVVVFLCGLTIRAHKRKSLTGAAALLSKTGITETDLNPKGQVFIHGEIWKAVADTNLPKGTSVKVVKISGLTLYVAEDEKKT